MADDIVANHPDESLFERMGWGVASQFIPSEYTLSNQVLFQHIHHYRPIDGDLPCIEGLTYDKAVHLMPLFDLARIDPARLAVLLADRDCFYPIPRTTLDRLDAASFQISSNDQDSDYVYLADSLREYAAAGLNYKRKLLRRFMGAAAPYLIDSGGCESAMVDVLEGWLRDVGKDAGETDFAQALAAIRSQERLGLAGQVALTDAGEAVGFVLGSRLGSDCLVVHFAKGRRSYDGVYPFLFSAMARLYGTVKWLNFEQDLGNPRLRQNKRSFMPAHHVIKYRLKPKPAAERNRWSG